MLQCLIQNTAQESYYVAHKCDYLLLHTNAVPPLLIGLNEMLVNKKKISFVGKLIAGHGSSVWILSYNCLISDNKVYK